MKSPSSLVRPPGFVSTLVPVWTLLVLPSEALVLGVVPAVVLCLRTLQCCSQCRTGVCSRRPASLLLPRKHSTGASSVYKSCLSARRARLVLLLQPVLPGSRGPLWTTAHLLPSQSPPGGTWYHAVLGTVSPFSFARRYKPLCFLIVFESVVLQ